MTICSGATKLLTAYRRTRRLFATAFWIAIIIGPISIGMVGLPNRAFAQPKGGHSQNAQRQMPTAVDRKVQTNAKPPSGDLEQMNSSKMQDLMDRRARTAEKLSNPMKKMRSPIIGNVK